MSKRQSVARSELFRLREYGKKVQKLRRKGERVTKLRAAASFGGKK